MERHSTYNVKKTAKTWESFGKSYTGDRATAATLMQLARPTGWYPNDPIADEAVAKTAPSNDEPEPAPVSVHSNIANDIAVARVINAPMPATTGTLMHMLAWLVR
jgi:hypothetical protein